MTDLKLAPNFDANAALAFQQVSERILARNMNVNLDLSATTFIDPSGIGALAFLYKRLLARGLQLSLVGVHGQPLQLLGKLRLLALLNTEHHKAAA